MKVFRELEIHGPQSALNNIVETIEPQLREGWTRRSDLEEKMSSMGPGISYCFSCTRTETREAADLWLVEKNDDTLYVSNIVPSEIRELNFDQYNLIVEEFYQLFVVPSAEQLALEHSLSSDKKSIEDWMSAESARKLKLFSDAANKSTGSAHPLDKQRWFEFLISAHNEKIALDTYTLMRWLIEEEGWFEDEAHELILQYEFAMSLLTFYDESLS